ncbi:MAG: enoyl-CoA hydratase/isomerase family protein [Comamonadaceae bacterium]|nr:MAG: enoyl-CoA hydratase/isomerase family protein [Comamonadaceae bacterium]
MTMGTVHIAIEAGIAHLTLDAPPMNTLDRGMVARLGALLHDCERDDAVRAVLLHGAGDRAFSAGSDLAELRGLIDQGRDALAAKFAQDDAVFGALARFPKPTLAAIEGAAVGGGLELAVCCDLLVASRAAKLALPEIRLGVFPGSGGTVRVTRRIGPARARRMMLLGDAIDAATAHDWGLVDALCDEGAALQEAGKLAARLAAGPALAQQGCKAAIDAALDLDEAGALAVATDWAVTLGFSGDLAEGLRAFDAKRRPAFGADRIRIPTLPRRP